MKIYIICIFLICLLTTSVNAAICNYVISDPDSNYVVVIDPKTNTIKDKIPVGQIPCCLALKPGGREVYVCNVESKDISVIDTATNTVTHTIKVSSSPSSISFSRDGLKAYSAIYDLNEGENGFVSVIDTRTYKEITTYKAGNQPQDVEVSKDGKYLYIANGGNGNTGEGSDVLVLDAVTGKLKKTIDVENKPYAITIKGNTAEVYYRTRGDVTIIDLKTYKTKTIYERNVPEFPNMILPVLAILGLFLIFSRKNDIKI